MAPFYSEIFEFLRAALQWFKVTFVFTSLHLASDLKLIEVISNQMDLYTKSD